MAWFTLWQAAASTVLTLLLGLLPAFVLARYRFPGRALVLALVTVPFVLPTVVVGSAFLALLPASWDQTAAAIIVAHVYFNLAVVVRTVGTLWAQLDPAPRTPRTPARPRQVLWKVTLPQLRPVCWRPPPSRSSSPSRRSASSASWAARAIRRSRSRSGGSPPRHSTSRPPLRSPSCSWWASPC